MLRDHSRELGSAISQIDELLALPFHSDLPLTPPSGIEKGWPNGEGGNWSAQAMAVFQDADAMNVVLFKTFAAGTQASPEQAIVELLSRIPELKKNIERAATLGIASSVQKQASLTGEADRKASILKLTK